MDALKTFRWIALIEGISFVLLLFVAMPLKYGFDMPLAVRIAGAAHGVLFLLFCGTLFRVVLERRWPLSRTALAFGASLVPFATFAFDRSIVRELRGS